MVYNQQCILVPLPHPHRGEHLCHLSTLLGCPHEHHELQCRGESPDRENKSKMVHHEWWGSRWLLANWQNLKWLRKSFKSHVTANKRVHKILEGGEIYTSGTLFNFIVWMNAIMRSGHFVNANTFQLYRDWVKASMNRLCVVMWMVTSTLSPHSISSALTKPISRRLWVWIVCQANIHYVW